MSRRVLFSTVRLLCAALIFSLSSSFGSNGVSFAEDAQPLDVRKKATFDGVPVEPQHIGGYLSGYTEEDLGVYRCEGSEDEGKGGGVVRFYRLDQQVPEPICASGWSRAENVGGTADGNYSLYLDIEFADGTMLWGQNYAFPVGDRDWNFGRVVVFPEKPIKSLYFYGLFRSHTGTAFFKDLKLNIAERDSNVVFFDSIPIEMGNRAVNEPRVILRDVSNNGDFVEFNRAQVEKGVEWNGLRLKLVPRDLENCPLKELAFQLESLSDEDRAITLIYSIPLSLPSADSKLFWGDNPRLRTELADREYICSTPFQGVGMQRLSKYPLGVVSSLDSEGIERATALAIDPDYPAFYRIAANGSTRELYAAFDVALTSEVPKTELRVLPLSWTLDANRLDVCPSAVDAFSAPDSNVPLGSNAFRAALDVYRRAFPEKFEVRAVKQGLWMAFSKISNVKGWEDFGFQFKEGIDEIDQDDAKGITSFRYTEPTTYWQYVPEALEAPNGLQVGLELAKKNALEGRELDRAFLTTGIKDDQGCYFGRILDTPWCKGIVWSVNDAPGLADLVAANKIGIDCEGAEGAEPVAHFSLQWNARFADNYYGKPLEPEDLPVSREERLRAQSQSGVDGEYIDSSEGYVTTVLDYVREHFQGMKTPLVFSTVDSRPAIFRGLIMFEYVKQIADDVHCRGKLAMANSTPDALFWLTPQLDVLGTETNWNYNGWTPMSDSDMLYRRSLCCGKPYCYLMNTDYSQFPRDYVEAYMKRSLAYGFFPGFFSANASTDCYFDNPNLYERDRELFKRYVPLCKLLSESGWEPETGATSNDSKVYVERFGSLENAKFSSNPNRPSKSVYLTIFNDSEESKEYEIALSDALLRHIADTDAELRDLLDDEILQLDGAVLKGTLDAADVRLIEIAPRF